MGEEKRYETSEPLGDTSDILRLMKPEHRWHKYLVSPDELRMDYYEDGINMESRYYKVSHEVFDALTSSDLMQLSPKEHRRIWEPPLELSCFVLSENGRKSVAAA